MADPAPGWSYRACPRADGPRRLRRLARRLFINQYYQRLLGTLQHPVGYDGSHFLLPHSTEVPAALSRLLRDPPPGNGGGTWMPEIRHSTPDETDYFPDGTPRWRLPGWPVRDGAALEPLEQRWVGITHSPGRRMSPDAGTGPALRAGLRRSRLAVDDARLAAWLGNANQASSASTGPSRTRSNSSRRRPSWSC